MIHSVNAESGTGVVVDWAPTYELLVSLRTYANTAEHRVIDLGPEWVRAVQDGLTPSLARTIADRTFWRHFDLLQLLVWLRAGERSIAGFLQWVDRLTAGDLLELVVPFIGRASQIPGDAGGLASEYAVVLDAWNEQYFSQLDPSILHQLEREADMARERQGTMSTETLIESLTGGLCFALAEHGAPKLVVLVPQYHLAPLNGHMLFRDVRFVEYPADVAPRQADMPSRQLVRATQALSEETRLCILRLIARGPERFGDIAAALALPKSTLHHHLVILRAAGLVRVFHPFERQVAYALRGDALERVGETLRAFIQEE
jgi:DNA-binding transcriptional ArsR family regulator